MCLCSSSLPTRGEHIHVCTRMCCGTTSSASWQALTLGSRFQQRSWMHPKPLFPEAQQPGKRDVHGCVLLGGGLFWESPPGLLLVLMLCDNNLSWLSLVYAGHEKALCAAQGAGCQLGRARSSLCALQLHSPQQGCAGGLRRAPRKSRPAGQGAELLMLSSWALSALHTSWMTGTQWSSGCSTSKSSRHTFPSKENIYRSWCHLPPGCSSGIQSSKSLGLRCHYRCQIKPLLSLPVWNPSVLGDKQASHCLHPLLPKEKELVPNAVNACWPSDKLGTLDTVES